METQKVNNKSGGTSGAGGAKGITSLRIDPLPPDLFIPVSLKRYVPSMVQMRNRIISKMDGYITFSDFVNVIVGKLDLTSMEKLTLSLDNLAHQIYYALIFARHTKELARGKSILQTSSIVPLLKTTLSSTGTFEKYPPDADFILMAITLPFQQKGESELYRDDTTDSSWDTSQTFPLMTMLADKIGDRIETVDEFNFSVEGIADWAQNKWNRFAGDRFGLHADTGESFDIDTDYLFELYQLGKEVKDLGKRARMTAGSQAQQFFADPALGALAIASGEGGDPLIEAEIGDAMTALMHTGPPVVATHEMGGFFDGLGNLFKKGVQLAGNVLVPGLGIGNIVGKGLEAIGIGKPKNQAPPLAQTTQRQGGGGAGAGGGSGAGRTTRPLVRGSGTRNSRTQKANTKVQRGNQSRATNTGRYPAPQQRRSSGGDGRGATVITVEDDGFVGVSPRS